MTRTVTTTQSIHGHDRRRPRALSVSLIGKETTNPPATYSHSLLQSLPSELITSIINVALSTRSVPPRVLAAVCRVLHQHLNDVLYRTIIVSSTEAIRLLRRTSFTSPHLLLLVKKLVLLYEPPTLDRESREIIRACKNLHVLRAPYVFATPGLTEHANLEEISLKSFLVPHTSDVLMGCPSALKRLRLVEPADFGWISPRQMLDAFGKPQGLTHLELSRKAGAHEGNDIAFRDDVVKILDVYRTLEVVVVSIYQGHSWETRDATSKVKESHVWRILEEVQRTDKRLVILERSRGGWENEDKDKEFSYEDDINSRFWTSF